MFTDICRWPQYIATHRRVLYSEPDFDVSVHHVWLGTQWVTKLHLDVFYFSPATLRHMLGLWPSIREPLPPIILCMGDNDGPLFNKFVTRFGWRHVGESPCSDGKTRRIYAHCLPKNNEETNRRGCPRGRADIREIHPRQI